MKTDFISFFKHSVLLQNIGKPSLQSWAKRSYPYLYNSVINRSIIYKFILYTIPIYTTPLDCFPWTYSTATSTC